MTDELESGVRKFVDEVTAAYARLTPPGPRSAAVSREIAERVREPWRQGGPEMHDIRTLHTPTRHGQTRVRLYRPGAAQPAGTLVYLHGGGFTIFSLDTHDRIMRELAARSGMAVVGVDYSLSPEAKFPQALEEVVDVVRWLAADGAQVLDIRPDALAIGGDSAGGNLSFGAALTLRDAGEGHLLKAIATAYGGFGVVASDAITARYGGEGFMLTREESLAFWKNYLDDESQRQDPLVCPIKADLRGLPPVFLCVPRCDINSEQNLMMAERLQAAETPTTVRIYEGATHSFLEAVSVSALAGLALDDMSQWLARTVRDAA